MSRILDDARRRAPALALGGFVYAEVPTPRERHPMVLAARSFSSSTITSSAARRR
jgi:hypothetical protein